ncbi:ABC transporter permease [Phytohabitans suffuscus]|uniref:ABC transporter permease n=1 Tax=Phytohabitans suffuscus TaxID=624315 RepID=A0A6F8YFC8_9ACTN|nr:ABC transporter permease [Phytohabitans suffuscus]BCB84770.1 ABC transporter permease [Phytohabitans suffuscus]
MSTSAYRATLAGPTVRGWLRRPGLLLSCLFLLVVAVAVTRPSLLAGADPLHGQIGERLRGPEAAYLFGTDHLGRDLFARVVHGARLSLAATGLAVALGAVTGTLLGLAAGYRGGVVDAVLSRLTDVLLAIPSLLLSLAVVTALGRGTVNIAVAVGVGSIAAFTRLARAEVLRVRRSDYVEAAQAIGIPWWEVVARHVLPNSAAPVLALVIVEFAMAILSVASLSFLGYGAQPPTPEWGVLIAEGRDHLATSWWMTTLPGLTVVALVVSLNRIARAVQGR